MKTAVQKLLDEGIIKKSPKGLLITEDSSIFEFPIWNREVKDDRIAKIIKSITEVGYITNPLVVNEKLEIIDGQGRCEALAKLGLPIEFVVHEGAGREECISLNIHQSNWTLKDYVNTYANTGDETYKWLRDIHEEYKRITLDDTAKLAWSKGKSLTCNTKPIEEGRLKLDEDERKTVRQILNYLNGFVDIVKAIGGRKFIFYSALTYCYYFEGCDYEKLAEQIKKHYREIPAQHTIVGYLKYFENFYNLNQRKDNRLFFSHQFEVDN